MSKNKSRLLTFNETDPGMIIQYGLMPFIDSTKGGWSKDTGQRVRNYECYLSGTNYVCNEDGTPNPAFWGCYPLIAYWPGRVLETSTAVYKMKPGLIKALVESFERGDQTGEPSGPVPFDYHHFTYESNYTETVGYGVKFIEYSGKLCLRDGEGNLHFSELPEGASILMAKIMWLPEGYKLVSEGRIQYPSIVFTEYEDGQIVLRIPTVCLSQADKKMPAYVIASDKQSTRKENPNMGDEKNKKVTKKLLLSDFKKRVQALEPEDPVRKQVESWLDQATPEQAQAVLDWIASQTPQAETPNNSSGGEATSSIKDFFDFMKSLVQKEQPQAGEGGGEENKAVAAMEKLYDSFLAKQKGKGAPDSNGNKNDSDIQLSEGQKAAQKVMMGKGMPASVIATELKLFGPYGAIEAKEMAELRFKNYAPPKIGSHTGSGKDEEEQQPTNIYKQAKIVAAKEGIPYQAALDKVKAMTPKPTKNAAKGDDEGEEE